MIRCAPPKRASRSIASRAGFAPRALAIGVLALVGGVLGAPNAGAEVRLNGEVGASFRVGVKSWAEIPFRTTIRQQFDYSCGSAAVATLMRYHYGMMINEADAFRAMFDAGDQERIRQVGFSMLDMRSYLQSLGFQAEGFRISLDRLTQMRVPGIALIVRDGYRHFVVVKGVRGDEVLLGDPTAGLRVMKRADFEAMWNGVILAIRSEAGKDNSFGFNREDEWRPWSSAPLDIAARFNQPVGPTLVDQAPLYQIAPVRLDQPIQ